MKYIFLTHALFWSHVMCSNAWYRLKPKITTDPETHRPVVQFQHPVAPGNVEGGWMVPPKEQQNATNDETKDMKTFSLEEIMKHYNEVGRILPELSSYAGF